MKGMLLAALRLALAGCATTQGAPGCGRREAPVETARTDDQMMPPARSRCPNNILLADFTGPYDGVPQWDKVSPALFDEAFAFAIDEQRREIAAITANPAAPTFANTIVPYEKAGQRLGRVETYFGVMTDNMPTPEYQALDKQWSPKLSAAYDEITVRPGALRAGQGGLRARDQRRPRRQADAAGDAHLRGLHAQRRRARSRRRRRSWASITSSLRRLFSDFSDKVLADEAPSSRLPRPR